MRFLLAIVLLCASARTARALDPAKALTQYPQTTWRTDDGLPQNNVHAIARDGEGYLWLGTESGLARFDGVRFVAFLSSHTDGIANNSVWSMLLDRGGTLWIGTEGGLTRRESGRFRTFTTADGLPNNLIHALHEDAAGVLWVGTGSGLARFDGTRFVAATEAGAPSAERVRAILGGPRGTLWVGTERGLFHLEDARWSKYTRADGLAFDVIYALSEDRDGRLWVGTYGGGVSVREGGRFRSYGTEAGLAHLFVYAIHSDRDGGLWFGTEGGLSRWREGRFESITPKEGLAHDRIWTLHEDGEGSLWLGTRGGGGLIRLKDGVFTTYGPPEGLLGGNMYGAHEDGAGNVWAAMLGTGIARIGRDGHVRNFTDRDGLAGHNRMWTVYVDRAGTVWAGGDNGLFRLQGERFVAVPGIVKVRALLESKTGTLWIGTVGEGLGALDKGVLRILHAADGLPNDFPTALYEDDAGALWIGTWGAGAARLENGKVVQTYAAKDGLASDSVKVITRCRGGSYWFGTTGGLSRLQDGKLTTFSMKDGLHDDVLFQIFEDADDNLWLGSTRGVFRVAKRDLDARARGEIDSVNVTVYGTGDGLRVGACTGLGTPAGFKGRDGRFWFTTPKGLSVIDPAMRKTSAWQPAVVVEDLLANGKVLAPADGMALAGGVREIEIRYTALSLRAPERTRFRVWLDGFDTEWRDVGPRRAAYYTNLPPRDYRFRVTAYSPDGAWAEAGQALGFRVEPLFYQTRWFAGLALLSLALVGVGVHRWRVRALRESERTLARRVDEAVKQVKHLHGLLPICAACKKIRDDKGYWNQIELYIHEHSQAEFSHSICPDCMVRLYPDYAGSPRRGGDSAP
jgi:ligand-binding sensor domain-containing protein